MCGICGIITKDEQNNRDTLRRMSNALTHRGPDSYGEDCDEWVKLAIRRLRIIDLAHGDQPLFNEDNSLVLIANGEIYNYIELQKEPLEQGHNLATNNDCEVILHLYEMYGVHCLQYLRGMFAFALYDKERRQVCIARDQIGEKPLYYSVTDNKVVFSSEMKSILQEGSIPFELDLNAVNLYFHYQYVPEPKTPIIGISKLPAGHYMMISLREWTISLKKYWDSNTIQPLSGDPVSIIRDELQRVGELVIRSDVPIGVALSGGIDSSAVAALAAINSPEQVHTFSIGYTGNHPCDETPDAARFAEDIGVPFHATYVDTEDIVSSFPKINYLRDDPIADISGHSYYTVCRASQDAKVPVLLFGHGGDEFFWGYQWVVDAAKKSHLKQMLIEKKYPQMLGYMRDMFHGKQHLHDLGMDVWNRQSLHVLRSRICSFRNDDQLVFMDAHKDFQEVHFNAQKYYYQEFLNTISKSMPYDIFRMDPRLPEIYTVVIEKREFNI